MLIAIISDIHNNEVNLKKVLDYCKDNKIEKIICCGDLASIEMLKFLSENFSGNVYYVFGNMDRDQLQDLELAYQHKNIKIFQSVGEIEIGDKRVAFVHYPRVAKKLAEIGKYDFVFYGHTHKPWVSSVPLNETTADQGLKSYTMLNPGNVAGEIYPPTFAIWNTKDDKFELICIHNLN
jgi:uncharacterized protein